MSIAFRLLVVGILAWSAGTALAESAPVTIGFLSGNPPSDTEEALAGFRAKLHELGYAEGTNLSLEVRYANGRFERLPGLMAELLGLKINILFTYGSPASQVAKKSSGHVPVVFGGVADPLAIGLVNSLTRPGGAMTGVTSNNPELTGKRLGLLKEVAPAATRLAVLANPEFQPTGAMLQEAKLAARPLGVELEVFEARTVADIPKAFAAIKAAKADGVAVLVDPMFIAQRRLVAELALKHRIPTVFHLQQFVEVGGLLSYGVDYVEAFKQSAALVDKILKGAKAGELPVEQPWRFPLVVNLKTAKTLGLTVPQSLLLRADRIIE